MARQQRQRQRQSQSQSQSQRQRQKQRQRQSQRQRRKQGWQDYRHAVPHLTLPRLPPIDNRAAALSGMVIASLASVLFWNRHQKQPTTEVRRHLRFAIRTLEESIPTLSDQLSDAEKKKIYIDTILALAVNEAENNIFKHYYSPERDVSLVINLGNYMDEFQYNALYQAYINGVVLPPNQVRSMRIFESFNDKNYRNTLSEILRVAKEALPKFQ